MACHHPYGVAYGTYGTWPCWHTPPNGTLGTDGLLGSLAVYLILGEDPGAGLWSLVFGP